MVRRDLTFEIGDVSARHVTILGGLAGFAVAAVLAFSEWPEHPPESIGP